MVFPDALSTLTGSPPRFVDYSVLLAFSVHVASLVGSSQQHSQPPVLYCSGLLSEVTPKIGATGLFCSLNLFSVDTAIANVQSPTLSSSPN